MDDTVIELSPFTVDGSKDFGYVTTNTTSGTSLDIAIRDLPISVEVISSEFIDDTAATDFDELVAYSAGIFTQDFKASSGVNTNGGNTSGANAASSADRSPSSAGINGRFNNSISLRGFNVAFQNREGFRYGGLIANYGVVLGGIVDSVNVERTEIVRGPNSLLYGIGVLSGITNMMAKRPLDTNAAQVKFTVGSEGYYRFSADYMTPVFNDLWGGKLLARAAAAYEEGGNWTDFFEKQKEYYVGQLVYQKDGLDVFLEFQHARLRQEGIGSQFIYDNLTAANDGGFRNEFGEHHNWQQDNWSEDPEHKALPDSYRITGPDTFTERIETDLLFNINYNLTDALSLSAGIFYTDADETLFDVNISTLTNIEGGFVIDKILREADPKLGDASIPSRNWVDQYLTTRLNPDDPTANNEFDDNRVVRYWWTDNPTFTTTFQYRLRMAYEVEHELFRQNMRHTFLLGRHDIEDEAKIAIGRERIGPQFSTTLGEIREDDILLFRNIDDNSIIRYNGELTAVPGTEYRDVSVYYQGSYAAYQGRLFNDALTLIIGGRRDRYHSKEYRYDRFDETDPIHQERLEEENLIGYSSLVPPKSLVFNNPTNKTFGYFPLVDEENYKPDPDRPEVTYTGTFALSWRMSEAFSAFYMHGEGVTPNTGLTDGDNKPIASENATSDEIGIKFDAFNNKLSGTLSVYRIRRENAVWFFKNAPAPVDLAGGPVGLDESPALIPASAYVGPDATEFHSYGVDSYYFGDAELGKARFIDPDTGKRVLAYPPGLIGAQPVNANSSNVRTAVYLDYANLDQPAIDKHGNELGHTWRHYLEKAFADRSRGSKDFVSLNTPDDFDPIIYTAADEFGLNPSNNTGANVTYTDEANGFDFQLIYSPLPNFQVIATYAHTERAAISPFSLVSAIEPETGLAFGTEYDSWVHVLGREAFGLVEHDDDGDGVVDRVTKDGNPVGLGDADTEDTRGGIDGISLYSGSEDSATFWGRYQFDDGIVQGLTVGFGVIYRGPARTSFPIGGTDLAQNLYGTPMTPDYYRVDSLVKYQFNVRDLDMSIQLNVYNLLNDKYNVSIIRYKNDQETIKRRTEVHYDPISFRLSLSAKF